MRWLDAHNHLDDPAFDGDRDAVMARAREAGMVGGVVCASDPARWARVVEVARQHGLAWTLGLHPWWTATMSAAEHEEWWQALLRHPTPHGLGETGLDHRRAVTPAARALQLDSTERHLRLAMARGVPVVLHCVRAYEVLLRLLERVGVPSAGAMVHSWSGSAALVPRAVRLGLRLSFSASFLRSERLVGAMVATPVERLMLETDAPDQAVEPGRRGEPADLLRIAQEAARRRGADAASLLRTSAGLVEAMFGPAGVAR